MVKVKKKVLKKKRIAVASPTASPKKEAPTASPKKDAVKSPKISPTIAPLPRAKKLVKKKKKSTASGASASLTASPKKASGSSPILSPKVAPSISVAPKVKKLMKKKKVKSVTGSPKTTALRSPKLSPKVAPSSPVSAKAKKRKQNSNKLEAVAELLEDEPHEDAVPSADAATEFLKVFVGNIPYTTEEASVRSMFEKCGEIAFLELPLNDRDKPKGLAYVTFTNSKSVQAALKLEGNDIGGRPLIVKICTREGGPKGKDVGAKGGDAKGKSKGKDKGFSDELTAFIRGLPFHVDEAAIRKHFAECGDIERMNMPKNLEGNSRGLAFVTFSTAEGFAAAVKLDSTELDGRTMYISRAGEGGTGKGKDGKGKGKDSKGKGKDSKGKGKGKDSKGKGKDSKGKSSAMDE